MVDGLESVTLYDSMVSKGGAAAVLSAACVFCLQLIKSSPSSGLLHIYMTAYIFILQANMCGTGGDVSVLQNKVRSACASAQVFAAVSDVDNYGYAASNGFSDANGITKPANMSSNQLSRSRSYSHGGAEMEVVEPTKAAGANEALMLWRDQLWQEANKTLLLAYKPLPALNNASGSAQSKHTYMSRAQQQPAAPQAVHTINLLWSRVFRKPFLHQVESALHASSVNGLYRMQQRLLRAMYCVGVVVNVTVSPRNLAPADADDEATDEHTYAVSVRPSNLPHTSMASGAQKVNTISSGSVHLYHLAEELRTAVAAELAGLRTGIQVSEEDHEQDDGAGSSAADKESFHSLARSVQIYSCQLIGQVISLTRCISEACRETVGTSIGNKFRSNTLTPNSVNPNSGAYMDVWGNSVFDALLLLGRFAWLLKANGSFLADAFSLTSSDSIGANGNFICRNSLKETVILSFYLHLQAAMCPLCLGWMQIMRKTMRNSPQMRLITPATVSCSRRLI